MRTHRQTNKYDVAFRNFSNSPKKRFLYTLNFFVYIMHKILSLKNGVFEQDLSFLSTARTRAKYTYVYIRACARYIYIHYIRCPYKWLTKIQVQPKPISILGFCSQITYFKVDFRTEKNAHKSRHESRP